MSENMERGGAMGAGIGERLCEAQALHRAGQLELAGSVYEEVVAVDPKNAVAWHALGLLALQIGEVETAIDLLQEAIGCDPAQPSYCADLGEALRRFGKTDEAIRFLKRAREMGGDSFEVLLNLGCALGQQGDFQTARELLSAALELDPGRAEGYYNLGVVEQRDGAYRQATADLRMAVTLNPLHAVAWAALAETVRRLGQRDEAERLFRHAIELAPGNVDAMIGMVDLSLDEENLDRAREELEKIAAFAASDARVLIAWGRLCQAEGDDDLALAYYEQAVELAPREKLGYRCLAALYRERKEYEKALGSLLVALSHNGTDCELMLDLAGLCQRDLEYKVAGRYFYQEALKLRPTHVPRLNAAGDSMSDAGLQKEAIACLSKAVGLDPHNGESWMLLGYAQFRDGKLDEAVDSNQKALTLGWQPHVVHNNMGNILHRLGDAAGAADHYENALALAPNMLTAKGNLAMAYFDLGRFDESEAMFAEAEAIPPDNKMYNAFRLNRGFCRLSSGRVAEGWDDYEFRHSSAKKRRYPHPEWSGEELKGKTILLYQDQGVGDVVMFGTVYGEVIAKAGRCVIECVPKLVPLLRRTFPKAYVVPPVDPRNRERPHPLTQKGIDFQLAQGSLGRWFRRSLSDFPERNTAFLQLDQERVAYWRERFESMGKELKVGICWRSKVVEGGRSVYYTSLDMWGDIFKLPGVQFVNLQYDDCTEELAVVREKFGVEVYVPENVDMFDDLDETASLMRALDLVISAPTSVAILAAAAGVPVWQMSTRTAMGWTTFGTNRNMWFTDMRVFKRDWNGAWGLLLGEMAEELALRAKEAKDKGGLIDD